jgi:hypothetical protein
MPIGNTLSKKQLLAPGIAAALLMVTAPMLLPAAFAAPRLHGPIDCTFNDSTNTLNCQGDVSGLGGATTAQFTLAGTATVETGCINRGAQGQQPSGLDRETTDVSQTEDVNVEGGRASFDITLSADTDRDCPDGMTVVITCVEFSDVSLEVVPNSGPSRTFPVSGTFGEC